MTDYEALVKELTDLSEPFSYSPTLGSRAAAAVEALVAENESRLTVLAVTQARAIATVAAERDSALKALGESRARFADMEQRALAAEATVEAIRTVVTEWAVPTFSERHYGAHAAITKIRNALTEETP